MKFIILLIPYIFADYSPDISNSTLVLSMAELASNAYHNYTQKDTWRNTTLIWNYFDSVGWDNDDGLKVHISLHTQLRVIAITTKGTTLMSPKDRDSDNLMFGCDYDPDSLPKSELYIDLLLDIYKNLTITFPLYSFVFIGHSLGSALSSLSAMKTCNSAVSFSSPGEVLFASRINFQHNCGDEHKYTIHHIGYELDPIFTGSCGLVCSAFGYNMNSKCHHGLIHTLKKTNDVEIDVYSPDAQNGLYIYYHTTTYLIDHVLKGLTNIPEGFPEDNCTEVCEKKK
jgi:lipase ATG15